LYIDVLDKWDIKAVIFHLEAVKDGNVTCHTVTYVNIIRGSHVDGYPRRIELVDERAARGADAI
jgi:hypothetical protein